MRGKPTRGIPGRKDGASTAEYAVMFALRVVHGRSISHDLGSRCTFAQLREARFFTH